MTRSVLKLRIILFLTLSLSIPWIRSLGGFEKLDLWVFDRLTQFRPHEEGDGRIAIVGVTEEDIRAAKTYPFSDRYLAQILEKIKQHRPAVIGLDLIRDVPVPPASAELNKLLRLDNLVAAGTIGVGNQAIAFPPLASVQGDVTGLEDVDGKVRRHFLYPSSDNPVPNFALAIAFRYLKNQAIYPTADADGWLQLGGTTLFPLVKQAGGYAQSDMGGYQTLIRWRKNHKPFSIFSVADLLEGKIDPVKLKDKIVIVGSTAPSSNDTFLTPLVSPPTRLYGVEIHAHVLSQILAAALDDRPLLQATPVVNQNAFFLVVALGTAGVLPFVGKSTTLTHFFWKKGQFVVLILLLVSLFGVYSFVFSHYWLPLVSSYLFILLYGIFDAFLGFYGCHTEALESEVKQVAGELADAHRLLLEQSLAGAVEQIRGALIQEIGPNLRDLSIDIQSVQQEPYSNNLESKLINLETSLERIKNLVTYIVPAFNAVGDDAIPVYNYQQWLESIVRLTVSHRRRQSYILENIETTVCCSPELEQSAISLPQYLPVIIFAFLDNAFDACLSKLRLIELEEKLHIDVYIELIDDYLTISVEDNGQKVPDAIAETLFQPFDSEKGSFGLGLYLAQKFVQEHNGSIFYQDCGESKKFTVKILIGF